MLRTVLLTITALYTGAAVTVYWWLRDNRQWRDQVAAIRSQAQTRPQPPSLAPLLPLIIEAAAVINALLWPLALRTWRQSRQATQ